MFFLFFGGSRRSTIMSLAFTAAVYFLQDWWVSRSPRQRRKALRRATPITMAIFLVLFTVMYLRRRALRRWWQRIMAEWRPHNEAVAEANQLSPRDAEVFVNRLRSLPIEQWRPPHAMSSRELRQGCERLGLPAQVDRAEAIACIEERTGSTCVVCQEDFAEGEPLRCLRHCRHMYHVECIVSGCRPCRTTAASRVPALSPSPSPSDRPRSTVIDLTSSQDKWVLGEAAKGRRSNCPMCNAKL